MLLPGAEGKRCDCEGDVCSDGILDRSGCDGRWDLGCRSNNAGSENNSRSSGGTVEGTEVMEHDCRACMRYIPIANSRKSSAPRSVTSRSFLHVQYVFL